MHAVPQRLRQFRLSAVKKQFHVPNGLLVNLWSGQAFHAGTQAPANVKLQTRTRMRTVQIDVTGRNQKISMDQVNDSVSQVGREVRAIINAAILLQAPRDVHPWVALPQSQLQVGVSFVVPQQDVESRLFLLDEVIFKGQRFFVVGDNDVI